MKRWLIGLALVIGLFAPRAYGALVWNAYGGHQYALTQERNNWLGAEAEAVAAGGHLTTINDVSELDFISSTFKDAYIQPYPPGSPFYGNGNAVWIGLEYQVDSWQWVTGEPYTGFPEPIALSGGVDTLYGVGWHPGGVPHAYLHTDDHPYPQTLNNDDALDTNSFWYAYGVIERSGVVPEPSSLIVWSLIGLSFGGIGWYRRRQH